MNFPDILHEKDNIVQKNGSLKEDIKNIPIWLCIVPPPKAGEQYERTAILYHQQYTSKLGVNNLPPSVYGTWGLFGYELI